MPGRTLLLLLAASRASHAGPEPERTSAIEPGAPTPESPAKPAIPAEPPPSRETTATDVAHSPDPGFESGRAGEGDGGDSVLRRGARAVLYVPKLVVEILFAPVRGTIWAVERFHLDDLYNQVFFNYGNTIVLAPTAAFQSGFGFDAGVRFFDRDLFGAHEHFLLDTAFGGAYRQSYRGSLRSGDRLGDHLELELRGQYEQRSKNAFYGIGNSDTSAMPPTLVDPLVDPTAIETRYRERVARVAGVIDVRPFGGLHLRSSNELVDRTSSASEHGVPIDMVYDPATLVGFDGVRYGYSELELRLDERGRADSHDPVFAAGTLASAFGGRVHRLDGGSDYSRYGVDIRQAVRLGAPRALAVRLHGEAVSGTVAEVPFVELPSLGGATYLRGYDTYRFRDRVAAVGSLDYQWRVSSMVTAALFVDAGRVFASLAELSMDRLRVGYGIAFEHHSTQTTAIQTSLASSIDGGVFFNLAFNPVSDLEEPVRPR